MPGASASAKFFQLGLNTPNLVSHLQRSIKQIGEVGEKGEYIWCFQENIQKMGKLRNCNVDLKASHLSLKVPLLLRSCMSLRTIGVCERPLGEEQSLDAKVENLGFGDGYRC